MFEIPANSEVEVEEPWESDPAPNPEKREEGRKRRNVLGPYLPDEGNYSKSFGITAPPSSCHAMKGLTVWPSEENSCVKVPVPLHLFFWGLNGLLLRLCWCNVLLYDLVAEWAVESFCGRNSIRVCKRDHWYTISGFYWQIQLITNETHSNSAEVGFSAFLDDMRRSLPPGSFSPSNIPRSTWSLLALPSGVPPESPPKPQHPGHHGPYCSFGRGGFIQGFIYKHECF